MSIGFATLLVVAIIELLRPSFGTTIAALAAAAVVTMPLVTVQIDIVGMDLMMASATLVCLAALVRGRWWLATLAACGAYALKATGAIATVTVIAFVALSVAVGVAWYKNVELTGPEQPKDAAMKNPFYLTDDAKQDL